MLIGAPGGFKLDTTPPAPPEFVDSAITPETGAFPKIEIDPSLSRADKRSRVGLARAAGLMLKLMIPAAVLLVGGYFTMSSAVPVLKELAKPGATQAKAGEEQHAFVQALQKTREVVAKNDANVAYLDSVIADDPTKPAAKTAQPTQAALIIGSATTPQPASAGPKAPAKDSPVTIYAPTQTAEVIARPVHDTEMTKAQMAGLMEAVEALKITGVVAGSRPRILIDGLLTRPGDRLPLLPMLRFQSLNDESRLIVFVNEAGDTFSRRY